ncbi:hypothetical protein Murru_0152 [Allomuricauda ruestringensis DSM 13258]|uniref:Uncharacterized protein n=1 Tax=Allomuricauda ruestringensis (strain DSM 13258 / CIP 107369 / LMG 19739 / B1) TaxID=886377 RepID=G2PSE9_ALLRU|nr:hypothetical protein Murru_0152 [Allomuricauda ruestringensis DSM 13258]
MGVFGVMLNLPACRQRQVSTSHPAEYEHLYVTLNQVQGDVSDIMTHYGHSTLIQFPLNMQRPADFSVGFCFYYV